MHRQPSSFRCKSPETLKISSRVALQPKHSVESAKKCNDMRILSAHCPQDALNPSYIGVVHDVGDDVSDIKQRILLLHNQV